MKGRGVGVPAVRARALVPANGPLRCERRPAAASAGVDGAVNLVEIAARWADQHVRCVSRVLRQHVAGEEVELLAAVPANPSFHPQEVFDVGVLSAGDGTPGLVEVPDLPRELVDQTRGFSRVGIEVDTVNLLADDPGSHRVDVRPDHVAANPVRLKERSAPAHKWIRDRDSLEAVGAEVRLLNRLAAKLGQEQPPEQRSGPTGEPLVDGDDRAVDLLNLLLPEGKRCNKLDAVVLLYRHRRLSYLIGKTHLVWGRGEIAKRLRRVPLRPNKEPLGSCEALHLPCRTCTTPSSCTRIPRTLPRTIGRFLRGSHCLAS